MKTNPNYFFASGLLCISLFFACNRHLTSTGNYAEGEVNRDTIEYYPTMAAQLREDSVEKSDAYYYRINHVKREEITDGDSREVNVYDRFGHMLSQVHYLDGELFWKNLDYYNRFGEQVSGVHTFYDDGAEDNVYRTKYQYEPDGWTLGQRVIRMDMTCEYPDGQSDKEYVYTYSYKGRLLDAETCFVNGKCTEKMFYSYNDRDKPKQVLIVEYNQSGPDTTIRTYEYDSLGRQINWSEKLHGVLLNDHRSEYNSDGRTAKYSSVTYEPYLTITFEYSYLKNGLLDYVITTYNGKESKDKYSYTFY